MSENIDSKNVKIARNTAFLYIRMAFVLLVSLYTTRVILNVLGVVDYGIYNVVCGFVTLFSFLNSTLSQSIQRFYNFENGKDSDGSVSIVYSTAIIIHVCVALFLLVLLETIGLWYVNNVLVIPADRLIAANFVFQCSVFSLILLVLQIPFSAATMSHERMDFYALVGIIEVVCRLLIVFIIQFVSSDKLILYGILSMLISVLSFLLYVLYSKSNFKELKFERKLRKDYFKDMFSFAGWNTVDMFAYTAKSQGVSLVINAFFGPIVNAARGVANQVNNAIQGFSTNVIIAFRPQLVESYAQKDSKRVTSMLYVMSKVSYCLFFILSLPVALEIEYVLNIWLEGNVPEYTVPFTKLCLADMLICSLNSPLSYVVQAVGEIKWYNFIRGIIISSIVPISWLVLKLGCNPISVYWVTLIIVVINQPISMILLRKVYYYSYIEYCKEVLQPCVLFSFSIIVLVGIPHYLLSSGLLRLFIVLITDVILSATLAYFVILKDKERSMLLSFVSKKLHIRHNE